MSGPAPESPRSRESRFIEWAQRVNAEYASILRWTALVGFIVFAALGKLPVAAAFGGLIPVSLTVGKPGPPA